MFISLYLYMNITLYFILIHFIYLSISICLYNSICISLYFSTVFLRFSYSSLYNFLLRLTLSTVYYPLQLPPYGRLPSYGFLLYGFLYGYLIHTSFSSFILYILYYLILIFFIYIHCILNTIFYYILYITPP